MSWINTKAGLQMAETIVRKLPKLVETLHILDVRLEEINDSLTDIHEEIKSDNEAKRLEEMRDEGTVHKKIGNAMISSIGYRGEE